MKKLIIANWKCNPTSLKEAEILFNSVKSSVSKIKNSEVIICPPFVYLQSLKGLNLGAQDVFYKEQGAFTGEISPLMLRDLGVDYAIVGHSERRSLGETDDIVNKKVRASLDSGLKPILCVGEKDGEDKQEIIKKQITEGLKGISNLKFQISNLVIAYEPVWAIGTGKNCSPEETISSISLIRNILAKMYNRELANEVRIIYGGSVNYENSGSYTKLSEINGLLVGGTSLKADEFIKIIESKNG